MIDPILQLFSQSHWIADGVETEWNFAFEDGYLSTDYVKAYTVDTESNRVDLVITEDMFTGEFQLTITPAIPNLYTLVIYRDTPKNAPIVNFTDGANVSEPNLDQIARQAVHIAAEVMDGAGASLSTADLGLKDLVHVSYTGSSTLLVADRGKAHYKEDGTGVTVPNTLAVGFLSTIINNSDDEMPIAFTAGVGYLQGSTDPSSALWLLAPRNTLTLTKMSSGVWFIAGLVVDNS